MKKDREEKTEFSKILPNNQIITSCRIKLWVQEMTMNEKLTMIGLIIESCKVFCKIVVHFPQDIETPCIGAQQDQSYLMVRRRASLALFGHLLVLVSQ